MSHDKKNLKSQTVVVPAENNAHFTVIKLEDTSNKLSKG
jgi:hypothetical protein